MQHDPVAAYDLLAPHYQSISNERTAFLRGVESIILSSLPSGVVTLLDAGAGDGRRGLAIARAANIRDVTLLDPSSKMRSHWPPSIQALPIRLEQLAAVEQHFNLILCLWNVLGHVPDHAARQSVLSEFARLLSSGELSSLDVSHRYNARHYGLVPTTLRWLQDHGRPGTANGDVTAQWSVNGQQIASYGHVFTDREMRLLAGQAGLQVSKRWSIDYRTGAICRSPYSGHLLYKLQLPTHGIPAPAGLGSAR